jgi:hypothetical protein
VKSRASIALRESELDRELCGRSALDQVTSNDLGVVSRESRERRFNSDTHLATDELLEGLDGLAQLEPRRIRLPLRARASPASLHRNDAEQPRQQGSRPIPRRCAFDRDDKACLQQVLRIGSRWREVPCDREQLRRGLVEHSCERAEVARIAEALELFFQMKAGHAFVLWNQG